MEENLFSIKKICKFNFKDLNEVWKILYLCGKDMAYKYNLNDWNNSYFKDWIIVLICNLKNDIYLVKSVDKVVATSQIKKKIKNYVFKS